MARRGSKVKIDLAELEKLCQLQCTDEEIAAWFNVSARTIERRRTVKTFRDVMDRGKAKGRISVRRMQMKLLEQGNATMGVWLGKNILGQVDEIRYDVGAGRPLINLVLPRVIHPPTSKPVSTTTRPLIEAGDSDAVVEIEPADYEKD